ncbi:MAG: hypothetical protein ACC650_09045 [Gammaproteobacteria bacterium]
MIKLFQIFSVISLFAGSNTVTAGTILQIQNNNDMTTVLTDGKLARMNMPGADYVIVDYRKRTVKAVSPPKQTVMVLSADKMATGNHGPEVRTDIKELGAGIEVAGYPTQKYTYSANGKSCGVIYGSKDVYQKEGIKELFQAMKIMMEKQRAILGGLAGMVDDCTLADMKVSEHVKTIGVPMRTEKNGVVDSEIKSIRVGVDLPADTFVIPASYKTVTMEEQMRKAQQQVQQYQPQIQQMMQQMQQTGQMTPEMMEQMRRAQKMMQQ